MEDTLLYNVLLIIPIVMLSRILFKRLDFPTPDWPMMAKLICWVLSPGGGGQSFSTNYFSSLSAFNSTFRLSNSNSFCWLASGLSPYTLLCALPVTCSILVCTTSIFTLTAFVGQCCGPDFSGALRAPSPAPTSAKAAAGLGC